MRQISFHLELPSSILRQLVPKLIEMGVKVELLFLFVFNTHWWEVRFDFHLHIVNEFLSSFNWAVTSIKIVASFSVRATTYLAKNEFSF